MKGTQEYNATYTKRINNAIAGKGTYMKGFLNSLSDLPSLSTKYLYVGYINSFMTYIGKDVTEIGYDDFIDYLSSIETKKDGSYTTSSYRISTYAALKRFSNYLFLSDKAPKDYMSTIKRPKAVESQTTVTKRSKGYLTKEEIKDYMVDVKCGIGSDRAIARQKEWEERDEFIIKLLLVTGMRCSALVKLDIDDVDEENGCLSVTDKGNKIKIYDLPNEIMASYYRWKEKRECLLNGKECEALFISNQKTRMVQSSIARVVHKYAGNIEGKNITPHKLRATYGTQIYDSTKDIVFTQQCMGHSSPKTTELYIRNKKNVTKQASCIMSGMVD